MDLCLIKIFNEMKKFIITFFFATVVFCAYAQTPQAIKYQAIARNSMGESITNQMVSIRISFLEGNVAGTAVFTETHQPTTNQFGLFSLEIGQGTAVTGELAGVSWGNNIYFMQIEIDETGGNNYQWLGTSQLLSVPYALHAQAADSLVSPSGTIADADGDTKVQVEASPDEDKIRFAVEGTEAMVIDGSGILSEGTFGSGTDLSVSGEGTRMMWYPKKAAFRVGHVDNDQWDLSNIGDYSTAMGFSVEARGEASTAIGSFTEASEIGSIAMGWGTISSGLYSTAMGHTSEASGPYSVAIGDNARAGGHASTAMGRDTEANGQYSIAMGYQTTANGLYSTAMGEKTKAEVSHLFAIGRYNVGGGVADSWVETDPLFEIGNGSGEDNRANALTVLKNGNVGIRTNEPVDKLDIVAVNHAHDVDGGIRLSAKGDNWVTRLALKSDSAGNPRFAIDYRGAERVTIKNGNVGIATNDPQNKLDIVGVGLNNRFSVDVDSEDNKVKVGNLKSSPTTLSLASLGNVDISIDDNDNQGGKLFRVVHDGDEELMRVQENGRVGIGTTSPAGILDIAGEYFFPSTNGSNGQVLIAKSSGALSWGIVNVIADADNDTKINVEQSPDEDVIHFDIEGQEKWRMIESRLAPQNTGNSVFIGNVAGENDDLSDNENTFIGYRAGESNTTGTNNTAIGTYALNDNTTGPCNTAIGSNALPDNTTGYYNTAIGYNATSWVNNPVNTTALGHGAKTSESNHVRIGNNSVTEIGGIRLWTNYTGDMSVVRNVKADVKGLDFIMKLNPVTYYLDIDKMNEMQGIDDTREYDGKYDTEKIKQTGFIAQEVEQAAREAAYDFSGVNKPSNAQTPYGIRYSEFVVPLVKAMQEQQEMINKLQEQNRDLIKRLENLENLKE